MNLLLFLLVTFALGRSNLANQLLNLLETELFDSEQKEVAAAKPCVCASTWSDPESGEHESCMNQVGCPAKACDGDKKGRWCITTEEDCDTALEGGGWARCDGTAVLGGSELLNMLETELAKNLLETELAVNPCSDTVAWNSYGAESCAALCEKGYDAMESCAKLRCEGDPGTVSYMYANCPNKCGICPGAWHRDLHSQCGYFLPNKEEKSKKRCMKLKSSGARSVFQRRCNKRCFDFFGTFKEICQVKGKKCTPVTCDDSCDVCEDKYAHCNKDRKVDETGSYMKCTDSAHNWHRVKCDWKGHMLLEDFPTHFG